jgi:hypothetical protein
MANEPSTVAYDPEERFHEAIASFEQAVDAELGPLEVRADRRRAPHRLPGRLGDQPADDRRPLAGDVPQPVLVARLVLARHQPEIPADRLGVAERCGSSRNAATASAVRRPTPGMLRKRATAAVCCARWSNSCSRRRTWPLSASTSSSSRSRRSCCEAVGRSRRRSQARPFFVHRPGCRGGTPPAPATARAARSWPGSAWRSPGCGS